MCKIADGYSSGLFIISVTFIMYQSLSNKGINSK